MASGMYNRGKYLFATGDAAWATADLRILLTTSSYTPADTHNTVSQVTNELSGGSYVRKALTSKLVTENDTNDRAELGADDMVWATLDAAAGTPKYAVVYLNGVDDAARQLIAWIDLGTAPAPDGGAYEIAWASVGLGVLL